MKKMNLALSIILLIVFAVSCSKKDELINYENEEAKENINENLSEEQDGEIENNLEQYIKDLENIVYENEEFEEIEFDNTKSDNTEIDETEIDETEIDTSVIDETEVSSPVKDQQGTVATGVFYIDEIDWESYKTFDVSELFNVSNFTFDVISELSDEVDPSYAVVSGIAYAFTSTDLFMSSSGKESHQLRMYIGNHNNSDIDIDFYNGDENEIKRRYDDSVKVGQGSTMYDAKFNKKGNHKMFSYKYIGYASSKYSITGRIYLANADDSIPLTNQSNPDNKYRVKWIEFMYISPQLAQSAESVVTDQEIQQFDKFFDNVLESLIIEE